jgi:hypothetical protein
MDGFFHNFNFVYLKRQTYLYDQKNFSLIDPLIADLQMVKEDASIEPSAICIVTGLW